MTEPTMKAAATLRASLDVYCPYCQHHFDLFNMDDDGTYLKPIFNNDWDSVVGSECECPKCGQEFTVSEVIW